MINKKIKPKKDKYILAIETSCDDTSIAIYSKNKSDMVTISSAKQQSEFGGVVPELASRKHEDNLLLCLNQLFKKNKIGFDDIKYIAYTSEPGLKVCINMGKIFAHTLGWIHNKKVVAINHIYSHLFSFAINNEIKYPFIGLVASGGHTSIYYVKNINEIKLVNETLDDAIGEVYDKIGRKFSIKYPCGKEIDDMYDEKLANIKFINKKVNADDQFSFSGLKSQVLNYINKNKNANMVEVLSSFQKTIIDITIDKIKYYSKKFETNNVVIGGGVAANNYLRNQIINNNFNCFIPEKFICGDNALMIALFASLTYGL